MQSSVRMKSRGGIIPPPRRKRCMYGRDGDSFIIINIERHAARIKLLHNSFAGIVCGALHPFQICPGGKYFPPASYDNMGGNFLPFERFYKVGNSFIISGFRAL